MKTLNRDAFGENLFSLMQSSGYSVKDIADYLDVSGQAVYGWINGDKLPTPEKLVTIADMFGKSVDQLLPTKDVEWKGATLNGKEIEIKLQSR